jgi:hypothetical protein
MPQALLALAVLLVGGFAYAQSRGKLNVFTGQPVRFVFKDGVSSVEHEGRLRVLFSNVKDQGNGVYIVTPDQSGSILIPDEATVSGSTVVLT